MFNSIPLLHSGRQVWNQRDHPGIVYTAKQHTQDRDGKRNNDKQQLRLNHTYLVVLFPTLRTCQLLLERYAINQDWLSSFCHEVKGVSFY